MRPKKCRVVSMRDGIRGCHSGNAAGVIRNPGAACRDLASSPWVPGLRFAPCPGMTGERSVGVALVVRRAPPSAAAHHEGYDRITAVK